MPSIEIEVAYHAESKKHRKMARAIHSHYCRQAGSPVLYSAIGIPVYYMTDPARLVGPRSFRELERRFVVILVGRKMVRDPKWQEALSLLTENRTAFADDATTYLPIIYAKSAEALFGGLQSTILSEAYDSERQRKTIESITQAIAQNIFQSERRTDVFISYARSDGQGIATSIRKGLMRRQSTLIPFVDKIDMRAGGAFEDEIGHRIETSFFLAVLTDAYSSRSWCAKELLAAKEAGVPMLVIDAIRKRSDRLLPYVGNTPVIRWRDTLTGMDEIVEQVAYELIRNKHQSSELARVKTHSCDPDTVTVLSSHPEAHTLCKVRPGTTVLYPEPPITSSEQKLIGLFHPDVTIKSLTQFVSCCDEVHDGQGRYIGLSSSIPEDLRDLGMGIEHLEEALADLVRHLYLANYVTAYGGDWRKGGLTEIIAGVANAHSAEGKAMIMHNYFSNAYKNRLSDDASWKHRAHVSITHVEPEGTDVLHPESHEKSDLEYRVWQALSLTSMRTKMADDISARILLGGKIDHELPRGYPGILEEFFLSAHRGQPVFIIGGFGGCAGCIASALSGELKLRDFAPNMYDPDFVRLYSSVAGNSGISPFDPAKIENLVEGKGFTVLNNSLTDEENHVLATTRSSADIAQLVLKGLSVSLS